MKHTPGPWVAEKSRNFDGWCVQKKPDDITIANVIGYPKEVEANAYLIATAPELLGACKDVLKALTSYKISEYSRSLLKQVIAKAEGEIK